MHYYDFLLNFINNCNLTTFYTEDFSKLINFTCTLDFLTSQSTNIKINLRN